MVGSLDEVVEEDTGALEVDDVFPFSADYELAATVEVEAGAG